MFQSVEGIWLAPKMSSLWRGLEVKSQMWAATAAPNLARIQVGRLEWCWARFLPPIDHLLPKKRHTGIVVFGKEYWPYWPVWSFLYSSPGGDAMILQKTVSSLLLWQVWWAVLRKQAGVNTLWGTLETKLFGSRGCPVGSSISIP